jgi:hypothetical protein
MTNSLILYRNDKFSDVAGAASMSFLRPANVIDKSTLLLVDIMSTTSPLSSRCWLQVVDEDSIDYLVVAVCVCMPLNANRRRECDIAVDARREEEQ